jgi:hypothetical protein
MSGEVVGCKKVRVHVVAFELESPAKVAWASAMANTFKPFIKISQAPQMQVLHVPTHSPGVPLSIKACMRRPSLTINLRPAVQCWVRSHLHRSNCLSNVCLYGSSER